MGLTIGRSTTACRLSAYGTTRHVKARERPESKWESVKHLSGCHGDAAGRFTSIWLFQAPCQMYTSSNILQTHSDDHPLQRPSLLLITLLFYPPSFIYPAHFASPSSTDECQYYMVYCIAIRMTGRKSVNEQLEERAHHFLQQVQCSVSRCLLQSMAHCIRHVYRLHHPA